MTDAHSQRVTHSYIVQYPEHPPRKGDKHYKDFEEYRKRTKATAKCAVGKHRDDFSECSGELELHHHFVEFALQNGVDLAWLERDYPGVSDPDSVGAWVESADNLLWLCVLPGVPVLMADGTERAIEDVLPGDYVISGEGRPRLVEAVSRKRYRGEVTSFGSTRLTSSHRILSSAGWLPAAQIASQIRMFGPDVISVRGVEAEVGRSIIRPVMIDMMHPFSGKKCPAYQALHDPAMLHLMPGDTSTVHNDANVPLPGNSSSRAVSLASRKAVEVLNTARVGASIARPGFPVGSSMIPGPAHSAREDMVWGTPVPPTIFSYTGFVHDLSIAQDHSFIAGGIVVHNCEWHHRGGEGVHSLSSSDWEAAHYVHNLIAEQS